MSGTVDTGGGATVSGGVNAGGDFIGRDQVVTINITWQGAPFTLEEPDLAQLRSDYLAYLRAIRVDLPTLHEYAQAVKEVVQGWLGSLTPEDLERKLETPVGEVSLGQLLEAFVIWHINAHCGEISALKGCQGARGYPF